MRKITLLLLFVGCVGFSQEAKILGNQDGVEIAYQMTNLEKGDKKDKYLVTVTAVNKGNQELFYAVPLEKDSSGKDSFGLLPQLGFSKITVRNSTGWFGDGIQVAGQETPLRTEDNAVLFGLEIGKIYNFEFQFNTKTGVVPIITNSYVRALGPLTRFNLALSEVMINGNWVSSCGNSVNSLVFLSDPSGVPYINQTVNGRLFKWIRKTTTDFVRENDETSTLTYNKTAQNFTYANAEGVSCEWKKK